MYTKKRIIYQGKNIMKIVNTDKLRISLFFNAKINYWTLFGIYISWGEQHNTAFYTKADKIENNNNNVFIGVSFSNLESLSTL